MDAPEPAAVLAAFGISGPVVEMSEVSGAWSNRVFRLTTARSRYAVKQLGDPWGDAGWRGWLDAAWEFEQRAHAAGVAMPEPIPNPSDGGCLAWVETPGGEPVPVRMHRWVDGRPLSLEPVERSVAEWAGRVLAVLHGLEHRPTEIASSSLDGDTAADAWPALTRAAIEARAPWAGLLVETESTVRAIADLMSAARPYDEPEPMSHGDIDQKNIVRSPRGPVLCDWDVAHPVVPRQELVDVAMSLADWRRIHIARTVVTAYQEASGRHVVFEASDLGPALMGSLDWIRFNVERAIGARLASPAERATSGQLVPSLLRQLPRQTYVAQRLDELLAR